MKKKSKIIIILLAIVVFILSSFMISKLTNDKFTKGDKEVTLILSAPYSNYKKTINVNTDSENIGELLDELVADKQIKVKFDGKKDSEFGRYIISINDYDQDLNNNIFWLYSIVRDNENLAPNGIDRQNINDGDLITFTLTESGF